MQLLARSATVWTVAVTACTPLGAWVYGDPGFQVSQVRLREEAASDSTMVVALTLWNPNDYDISTARLELDLQVDNETVGRYERDSVIPMGQVDSTTLALAFTPISGANSRGLAAFRSGAVHRVVVRGRAIYKTPFGDRDVRVEHGGKMAFQAVVDSAGADSTEGPGPSGPCHMGHRPCGRAWESGGGE